MLVQGAPTGSTPFALGAVVYNLDAGSTAATLALPVASADPSTMSSTLKICPLTAASIVAESGGPIADAPSYNCRNSATAKLSTDGKTFTFPVADLASDDVLAVAVLPTAPTDRVAFAAPGPSSLQTVDAPVTDAGTTASTGVSASNSASAPSAVSGRTAVAAQPFVPQVPLATSKPARAPVLANTPATLPAAKPAAVSVPTGHSGKGALWVVLLVVMAAVTWGLAGMSAGRHPLETAGE
jgi:hypothetical protein